MGFFDRFKKKAPKAPAPAPAQKSPAPAPAPNTQQTAQKNSPSDPGLFDKIKARLGLGKKEDSAAPAAPKKSFGDKIDEWGGKANDWVEDKIAKAGKFVHDNTFGGKNKLFNAGLKAYDKVQDLKDDFHDWKDKVSEKYHNSAFGKAMDSAKASIKDKASRAGKTIKKGMGSVKKGMGKATNWIKKKAQKAGTKIKEAYKDSFLEKGVNKVKDKAAEAKEGIKNAYEGSFLQKGVNKVKSGLTKTGKVIKNAAVKAGKWVKDKYEGSKLQKGVNWTKSHVKSAKEWVNDKKERWDNYKEDFRDQLAAHDDDRYEKHRVKKYGAEYLRQKAEYEMMFKNGDLAQNAQEMADVDSLVDPEEESTPEKWSLKKHLRDKWEDETKNKHDAIEKHVGAGMDKGADIIGNRLDDDFETPISGIKGMLQRGLGIGLRTKEINDLKKLTPEQMSKGVTDEADKKRLERGRNAMTAHLGRKRITDIGGFIGDTARTIGGTVTVATGNKVGSAVGDVVGDAVEYGTGKITDHMRRKDDKKIAKEQMFGSTEKYDDVKKKYKLLRGRDMRIGMAGAANARNTTDIAERARYNMGKTAMKYKDKGQAGYSMMKARGYTDKGIENMTTEDAAKEMGMEQEVKRMLQRTRKAEYI